MLQQQLAEGVASSGQSLFVCNFSLRDSGMEKEAKMEGQSQGRSDVSYRELKCLETMLY
jgi:hypothetical protein